MLLHGIMSSIASSTSRKLLPRSSKRFGAEGEIGRHDWEKLRSDTSTCERSSTDVKSELQSRSTPIRGPLVKWALEAYATGDWSLNNLVEEVNRRGLEINRQRVKRAPGRSTSRTYTDCSSTPTTRASSARGIENPGKHEPHRHTGDLAADPKMSSTPTTFAGERHREHNHYLKGSVYCGLTAWAD